MGRPSFLFLLIFSEKKEKYVGFYKCSCAFCWNSLLRRSSTFTLLSITVPTFSSDKLLRWLSVIVERSLFVTKVSLLNDRSPVQFVTSAIRDQFAWTIRDKHKKF